MDKVTYHGSIPSSIAVIDDDVNTILATASVTKIKVYRAIVLTTLLYG